MNLTTRIGYTFLPVAIILSSCNQEQLEEKAEIIQIEHAEAMAIAQQTRDSLMAEVYEGFELSLWASDSLAKDPIALDMDEFGRAYITRTNRQKNSEFDIRGHQDWMTASVSLKTVEERRAFLRETFAPEKSEENNWLPDLNNDSIHDWRDLAVEKEEIYRIEDRSGDGIADFSQLYIRDFHEEVTDVAGAVLAFDDHVYVGVAPDMWRIEDRNRNGMADRKESISHGYAVHIGFGGHGMSGLTVGPDGRIYWSIGDIGFSITDEEGNVWDYPNQGAIFRSEPDGSGFEVFARGLRNTHEFVFDEYGNLFSVDNDGDHPGEKERLVYIVNGSDAGWRTNWQYGKYTDPDNNLYKVWMDEEYFKPRFEGQAAHIVPPIMNYHSGPAGMVNHPGNALDKEWRNHFFVAEFVGSPARSHVWAFEVEPQGAGFAFKQEKQLLEGVLATGMDFGPDGALYIADWIEGWNTKNYGRIWKFDVANSSIAEEKHSTQDLLQQDFNNFPQDQLANLLRHADMRIRQKAQFALAKKGNRGKQIFLNALEQQDHQLSRVHAVWGIGQLARKNASQANILVDYLRDDDPEIRAQVLEILGDIRYKGVEEQMVSLLGDPSKRVQFFAAEALGRTAYSAAVPSLIRMLANNNDEDVYLRHAGALALAKIGDADALVALKDQENEGVRLAAVVALRRLRHAGVAAFLRDPNEHIATDAARAINDDRSIVEALPALAALLSDTPYRNEPLLRRAINANLRLGEQASLQRLADCALQEDMPEGIRVEAIATIGVWPDPSVLDRVDGRFRGEMNHDSVLAQQMAAQIMETLLAKDQAVAIRVAAAETAGRLSVRSASEILLAILANDAEVAVRQAALGALYEMEYADMDGVIRTALSDGAPAVRMLAMGILPEVGLGEARTAQLLGAVLGKRPAAEQQAALEAIGSLSEEYATPILGELMGQMKTAKLMPDIQLELFEAIEKNPNEALTAQLVSYRASIPEDDAVAQYHESLYGGDAMRGRNIFIRNSAAQCARCHAIGKWGGDVGPELSNIASTLSREQLLESLVAPSARIAPGYGTGDISSMPPMGNILNRSQLRDLVAFLSELDGEWPSS